MADTIERDYGREKFGQELDNRPEFYEEITTMKTEVMEESCNLKGAGGETESFETTHMNHINLVLVNGGPGPDMENHKFKKEEELDENSYKCGLCCLEFEEEDDLKNHYQQQCPFKEKDLTDELYGNQDVFVCSFCKVEVSEEKSYGRHINWCEHNCLILSKRENIGLKKLKCEICGYTTKYNFNLQRHALVHSEEKQFKCEVCAKRFRRGSPLRDHLKIHDSEREKKVFCPYCNNSYYRKSALMQHINVKHVDHKKYKCDLCDYTTIDEPLLKRHIFKKHNNAEKRYECDFCTYLTDSKGHLTEHLRIHSNEKPFKCTFKYCQCTQGQVKPCDCKTCDFMTAHESTLKKHVLQKHSVEPKKYKCRDCKYSTHIKTDLTIHMRIHTNEKPFACGFQNCDYKCARRQHLKLHVRHRHSSERPFNCDKCGYTCASSSNLKRHASTKHNEM